MAVHIMKELVYWVLDSYLSRYIKNFDKDKLKGSLWRGNVQLGGEGTPLEIKPEALAGENMPVQVVFGVLEKFSLHIPWTTILGYGDIEVGIKGLYAVVEPNAAQEYDAEQEATMLQALKELQIQKIEHAVQRFRKQQTGLNGDHENSLWDSLLTYAMQHLKVKVEDIHIVYRDIVSVPRSPFVLGFSLDSIIMETDNPSQCETDCVGKKLYLNSLALYWNTGVGSKNELTWQYLKDHIARTATSVDSNSYLLKPVSAEAKLKINYGSDLGTSVPKMSAAIQLDDLTVELSSLQFRDMIKLYNMWDMMDRNSPYRKYQPKTKLSPPSPCNVVRQWWQYAINGVIEVQIKPSRWYLDKMLQHWLWFKEYLSCFEQKLKQPNLPPNVIRKLKFLETNLSAVAICVARAEADQRIPPPNDAHSEQGGSGYFGWAINKVSAWLGYDDDSTVVMPSTSDHRGSGIADFLDKMPPDEKERFYSSIGYSSYRVSSLKPKEYVKTVVRLVVCKLRLLLSGQQGNIGAVVLHDFEMLFEQRPSAEAIKVLAEVTRISLWGKPTDILQPRLIHVLKDQYSVHNLVGQTNKLFQLEFETNPLERAADFSVKAYLCPVEVKLDPPTFIEVGNFLTVEDPNYVDVLLKFAEQKLEEFRRQATENLMYSLENRKVVLLDLNLSSPCFIIPEFNEAASMRSSIVIDFGHLSVRQRFDRRESVQAHLYDSLLMDSAFVQYDIRVANIRVLVVDHDDDWKKALSLKCSPIDVLVPTELNITVLQSIQSHNPLLPKLQIKSVMPSLKILVSDKQLGTLLKVFNSLRFGQTERLSQRRLPELSPQASYKQSCTYTQDDVLAIVEVTANSSSEVFSADDALSFYSAEDDFPDGFDFPDRFDSPDKQPVNPSTFVGQSFIHFDLRLDQLQIDLRQVERNGSLQDHLSIDCRHLCFKADFRKDSWQAQLKLSEATISDKKRPDGQGHLKLLLSSSCEELIIIDVAWMDKKSFYFTKAPHWGEWEWILFVALNNLQIQADQDAFFEIRAVLERIGDACEPHIQDSLSVESSTESNAVIVSDSNQSLLDLEADGSDSWHVKVQLESLKVLVVENKRCFAVVNIHDLGVKMSVSESSTVIEAKLQGLEIISKHRSVLYKNILSLDQTDDIVFDIQLRLGNGKASSQEMFSNALTANFGRLKIIYLHYFFNRVNLFARSFTNAWAQLAKTTETVAKSAQKTVTELQQSGSSIEVRITVSAPLLHIPESSRSRNALLLNLGTFHIRNSLTDYHSARLTSLSSAMFAQEKPVGSGVQVEHYRLQFEEFGLVRQIKDGQHRVNRVLLKQLKLGIDMTRNLSVAYQDESIPLVHVWGEIPSLCVLLNELDYHAVITTYERNLGQSFSSTQYEERDEVHRDMTDMGSVRPTVKLRLSVKNMKLVLYTNSDQLPLRLATNQNYGNPFACFKISSIHLNGVMLADGAQKLTASALDVSVHDTRPNRPGAIKQILSHGKGIPSETNPLVPSLTIKYEAEPNSDRSVAVEFDRPRICLCVKFLLRLQQFLEDDMDETEETVIDGMPRMRTSELGEAKVNAAETSTQHRGHFGRRFAQSIRKVASQLTSVEEQATDAVPNTTDENCIVPERKSRWSSVRKHVNRSFHGVAAHIVTAPGGTARSPDIQTIPEDDVISNNVDGPLLSRSVSPVPPSQTSATPWKLSLHINCKLAQLTVPERAKDKDCPALVILWDKLTLEAFKEAGKTHIAASIQDLEMVSCVLIKPAESRVQVLRPCKAEIEGNFTTAEESMLLRLFQIDVTLYHSVLETMNSLLKSYQKNTNQGEVIADISSEGGEDLLVPQKVNLDRWNSQEFEQNTSIAESSKDQQLVVDAENISVTIQVKHTDLYRPVVVFSAAVNAELLNWSHFPTAGADIHLQASYYNLSTDAWEPLIEPTEDENGEYRKWKMSFHLIQLLNQPAVFKTDVKGEDELIQEALSLSGSEVSLAGTSATRRDSLYSMSNHSSSHSSLGSSVLTRINLAPRRSSSRSSMIITDDQLSSDDTDGPLSSGSELTIPGSVICTCIILTSTEPVHLVASSASITTLTTAFDAWYNDNSHPNRQSLFHPSVDEILIQIENSSGLKTSVIPEEGLLESGSENSKFAVESNSCLALLYSHTNGRITLTPTTANNPVGQYDHFPLQRVEPQEVVHGSSDDEDSEIVDDIDEPQLKNEVQPDQNSELGNCVLSDTGISLEPSKQVSDSTWVTPGESSQTESSEKLCDPELQKHKSGTPTNIVCPSSDMIFTAGDTYPSLENLNDVLHSEDETDQDCDPFQGVGDVFEEDVLDDDYLEDSTMQETSPSLFQFSAPASPRSHNIHQVLDIKQLFSLQFENAERMSNVPLNKTCSTLLPVGNADENDQRFAVCEVVCKPHKKTVQIRSPLQIENHLSDKIEILYQMPDDSADGYTHSLTANSGEILSVPIHVAYKGKIFLKPSGYKKGAEALMWVPESKQASRFLKFESEEGDLAPIIVQVSWKTSLCQFGFGRKTSSTTILHIHPPVVIANLLPIDILFRLEDEYGKYQNIAKGKDKHLVQFHRVSGVHTVQVKILGYQNRGEWVGAFEFSSDTSSSENISFKVASVSDTGKRKTLHLGVHVVKEMGVRLTVYCCYWIINKTTLPLIFKGKGGFHQRSIESDEGVLLLSFRRMVEHKLKFMLHNATSWSSYFAVKAVGNVDAVSCEHDDTVYDVYVTIEMSYTSLTKIVTLTPRYVVHNKSQYTLQCLSPPRNTSFVLKPTECLPFWPTKTKQMQLQLLGSDILSWPFDFNEATSFLLLLHESLTKPVTTISVNIQEEGVGRIIVLGPYYAGAAPIRLDNFLSSASIEFHQADSGQTHILQPEKSIMYTWDEPLKPKYICWRLAGSKEEKRKLYCIDGKGEFVIPVRRSTFVAARQVLATVTPLLPTITSESEEDQDSSVYDQDSSVDDETSRGRDETDLFRRRKRLQAVHSVGHWVNFLDGSQRAIVFTVDPKIVKKATQVEQLDKAYTDLFVSFSGVSVSIIDRQPREIAHISTFGTANWEICRQGENNVDTEWQPLNVQLSNSVEEQYEKLHQQDDSLSSHKKQQVEVLFDGEMPEMVKPYAGKLRRTYNPGFWYRWALSQTRSVNHFKIGRVQVDNQMDDAEYPVAVSELRLPSVMTPVETSFEVAWMSQQINSSCPVQYKMRASIAPLEVSLDLRFIYAVWRALQPGTQENRTEMNEISCDLESIQQLKWQDVIFEGTSVRKSLVEYLHIDPAEVKLNLSLRMADSHHKEDTSKLDKLQLFIGSLGFSLPSFEGVDLLLDSLQRIGVTMDTDECWSLILSHYQHQALSKAYKAILGLDIVGTSSLRGIVQDMTSFSGPLADISMYDVREDGSVKDDLVLGVRSVLGHVSDRTASMVSKTATSIGHRMASLTFDKKFQQKRQTQMKNLSGSVKHGLKMGGQALAMGVFDGVTGLVRQPVQGAKRKGATGLIKGLGKGLVGMVTRPVGGLVDMAAISLRTIRGAETVEPKPIRRPRCIIPGEALQPYSVHQAELQFVIKSLKEPFCHGNYVVDCQLDPRTLLVLTTEFLLLLGRDNADQDWAIDNNSLIGKTVRLSDLSSEQDKAVRIDPTGIRFFQDDCLESVIVIPNSTICMEFANQVRQQLCGDL